MYPRLSASLIKPINDMANSTLPSKQFARRKERFIAVTSVLQDNPRLEESQRRQLISSIPEEDDMHAAILASAKPAPVVKPKQMTWLSQVSRYIFSENDQKATERFVEDIRNRASRISDGEFLVSLADSKAKDALLLEAANEIEDIAEARLNKIIDKATKTLTHAAINIQREECKKQFEREASHQLTQAHERIRLEFIHAVNNISSQGHELYGVSTSPMSLMLTFIWLSHTISSVQEIDNRSYSYGLFTSRCFL